MNFSTSKCLPDQRYERTKMNNIHPDTTGSVDQASPPNAASRPTRRSGRSGDDVVRWAEFRLALWIGGFALAAILGSQGFLYSAIIDLKGEIGDSRVDTQAQIGSLRADMQTQFGELRERIVRIEIHLGIEPDSAGKGN